MATSKASKRQCRICENRSGNRTVSLLELAFGLEERFDYLECGSCGCLQIIEVPADLSRYYPEGYYSFSPPSSRRQGAFLKTHLKRRRTQHLLESPNLVGACASIAWGRPHYFEWLKDSGVAAHSKILDVGCGAGELLYQMAADGFTNLTGIDVFIDDGSEQPPVKIEKKSLAEVDDRYDFIMLNHSFEHMSEPLEELHRLSDLLEDNGRLLIRIPIMGSYAWRRYSVNWVQLDAPRHMYLHTPESLGIVAEAAGFQVLRTQYDSTDFQFWGSEQCERGIPLWSEKSHAVNPRASGFSSADIRRFKQQAAALNACGDGDSACFLLARSTAGAKSVRRPIERRLAG